MKNKSFCSRYDTILFLLFVVAFPLVSNAHAGDEKAIRLVLQNQSRAWNRGSLEDYMKGYWKSDSLVFIGKSVTYGYEATLRNYKRSYPDTSKMGKLQFDLLQVKKLSAAYYFIVGKWSLKRSIGDLQGHFTLVFRKINNSWLIISDHSS
jgi:ketosteroid isomerase-like protein